MRLPVAEAKWGGLVEGGAWQLSINGLLLLVVAAAVGGSICVERRAWNLEVRMLTLTSPIPNVYNIQMRKRHERRSSAVAQ